MSRHPDPGPSGMAGNGEGVVGVAMLDDLFEHEADAGEVERLVEPFGDAEHKHVAVFGFDLRPLEDHETVLIGKAAVVGLEVELAVLRQHEPVDGDVARVDPLAVVLHLGASVVGLDGVGVQVEDQDAASSGGCRKRFHSASSLARSSASVPPLSITTSASVTRSELASCASIRA